MSSLRTELLELLDEAWTAPALPDRCLALLPDPALAAARRHPMARAAGSTFELFVSQGDVVDVLRGHVALSLDPSGRL
jgi:hypothetical protein